MTVLGVLVKPLRTVVLDRLSTYYRGSILKSPRWNSFTFPLIATHDLPR